MIRKVKIKKLPQAKKGGNSYLDYYQAAPSFITSDLADPSLEFRDSIKKVKREDANIEAEGGETAAVIDKATGFLTQYKINGPRHNAGGVPLNVPPETFIFSDFHGKDFKLGGNKKTKDMDAGILAYFGLPDRKGGYTFADIAKKYDINKDIANLMDPTETKDKMTMDTLIANIKNKTKKLGMLAIAQESKKNDEIPKIAEPAIAALSLDRQAMEIPAMSIKDLPFYQDMINSMAQVDQEQAAQFDQNMTANPDQQNMPDAESAQMAEQMAQQVNDPNAMPQAMLGYQVFSRGGGLNRFIRRQEGGPGMMPPEAMMQQMPQGMPQEMPQGMPPEGMPPQGPPQPQGGGGGQMEQMMAQVAQALQQGAQPEEVVAALLEQGVPPQAVAQIFVQIGMPQDQVMQLISQVVEQMQQGSPEGMDPSAQQMPDEMGAEMAMSQQMPEGMPEQMPEEMPADMEMMAQYGMQVFAKGGAADKLGRFIPYAKKGRNKFDPDNIVKQTYSRRKGLYIYEDADGNVYETTEPNLGFVNDSGSDNNNGGGGGGYDVNNPNVVRRTKTKTPDKVITKYNIPEGAIIIERKEDEDDATFNARKEKEYREATDKSKVFVKGADGKYFNFKETVAKYPAYKGSDKAKVFNGSDKFAGMYQMLEDTFNSDPDIKKEFAAKIRAAADKDDNYGRAHGLALKNDIKAMTDQQLVDAHLRHQKRNLGLMAHGFDVSATAQNADHSSGITNKALYDKAKAIGVPYEEGADKRLANATEQMAYIGYRDLLDARAGYDETMQKKLKPFGLGQRGRADEVIAGSDARAMISPADSFNTNTTSGQFDVIRTDPSLEMTEFGPDTEIIPGEGGDIEVDNDITPYRQPGPKPWLQDQLNIAASALQPVNRYMPIRQRLPQNAYMTPQFESPIYRDQVASGMVRGMTEGVNAFARSPGAAASISSGLMGQLMDQAAQNASEVDARNIGYSNAAEAANFQGAQQRDQLQAAADADYYTNVVGSKAIYDKNKQIKLNNLLRNTVAGVTNMMKTQNLNSVYGDQFWIHPEAGGYMSQINGKSLTGEATSSMPTILDQYAAARKNPKYSSLSNEELTGLLSAYYKGTGSNAPKTKEALNTAMLAQMMQVYPGASAANVYTSPTVKPNNYNPYEEES
jgi:hypothetical protein